MPCLEVIMPETSTDVKKILSERLTQAFTESTGFSKEIFGIHYIEYEYNQTVSGGELSRGENRPYLHLKFYSPRLRRSVKQKVVKALTDSFVKCLGKPDWKPVIHLMEHPYDNVGVDGQLLSDAYEDCRKRKFYYDLPAD